MTRVLVVDDQRTVREGLAALLPLLDDVTLVGTAADGVEALAAIDDARPDIVLMDLRMPRMDGVEATRRIRAAHPGVQVVVLTTYADDASIRDALRAGARGYLTKDAGAAEIGRAIEAAHAGQSLLEAHVQARLLDGLSERRAAGQSTEREAEVSDVDRRRAVEPRNRRPARCLRGHRQNTRQPHLRQDRCAGPSASSPVGV